MEGVLIPIVTRVLTLLICMHKNAAQVPLFQFNIPSTQELTRKTGCDITLKDYNGGTIPEVDAFRSVTTGYNFVILQIMYLSSSISSVSINVQQMLNNEQYRGSQVLIPIDFNQQCDGLDGLQITGLALQILNPNTPTLVIAEQQLGGFQLYCKLAIDFSNPASSLTLERMPGGDITLSEYNQWEDPTAGASILLPAYDPPLSKAITNIHVDVLYMVWPLSSFDVPVSDPPASPLVGFGNEVLIPYGFEDCDAMKQTVSLTLKLTVFPLDSGIAISMQNLEDFTLTCASSDLALELRIDDVEVQQVNIDTIRIMHGQNLHETLKQGLNAVNIEMYAVNKGSLMQHLNDKILLAILLQARGNLPGFDTLSGLESIVQVKKVVELTDTATTLKVGDYIDALSLLDQPFTVVENQLRICGAATFILVVDALNYTRDSNWTNNRVEINVDISCTGEPRSSYAVMADYSLRGDRAVLFYNDQSGTRTFVSKYTENAENTDMVWEKHENLWGLSEYNRWIMKLNGRIRLMEMAELFQFSTEDLDPSICLLETTEARAEFNTSVPPSVEGLDSVLSEVIHLLQKFKSQLEKIANLSESVGISDLDDPDFIKFSAYRTLIYFTDMSADILNQPKSPSCMVGKILLNLTDIKHFSDYVAHDNLERVFHLLLSAYLFLKESGTTFDEECNPLILVKAGLSVLKEMMLERKNGDSIDLSWYYAYEYDNECTAKRQDFVSPCVKKLLASCHFVSSCEEVLAPTSNDCKWKYILDKLRNMHAAFEGDMTDMENIKVKGINIQPDTGSGTRDDRYCRPSLKPSGLSTSFWKMKDGKIMQGVAMPVPSTSSAQICWNTKAVYLCHSCSHNKTDERSGTTGQQVHRRRRRGGLR